MGIAGPSARCFISEDDPPSKQAILQAALRLFVRHGLAGTNVRAIGGAAGYTNPAMFKFFESKQALALHLFERCYLRLALEIERAAADPSFPEALRQVLDVFTTWMDEDLEAALFVQDGLRLFWPRLPRSTRRHSIVRALRALVERGIREGRVVGYGSGEVPVAALLGLMAQFGRASYFGEIAGPARERRGELELAVSRMLKAREPGS
jgi:AcrR family transcriptional regulator